MYHSTAAARPANESLARVLAHAIEAAFWHVGPGRVVGVEREPGGEIEVGIRMGGDQIEVRLDERHRVIEVHPEDRSDE